MKFILMIIISFLTINSAFTQNQDLINKAITEGDCETLHKFVNGTEGADQRLMASANQTIRRYTAIDSATGKYRTNKMDARVRAVGKDLMENIFLDPEKFLPDVVAKLTTGMGDQFLKAKVLHDWICDNIAYDVETAFGRANRRQDYVSVLKAKKGVCAGYANLFNQMCRLASVESIGIEGYSKGFGYTGRIGPVPDHAWNAVKINNKWYLIDVTWDAGQVDQKTFIKNYSTGYLFLDSRPFLYSHLPSDNKYQFYAPVVTKEQFMDEPYLTGVFFQYRLGLKNELPRYNNFAGKDGITIEIINSNSGVQMSGALRTAQMQEVEGASWQGKSGNTVSFIFDVPDNREYMGFIFARLSSDKRIQDRIPISYYEQRIMPLLDELLQNKKITEREKELFINSYFKVQENGYYYFLEDQFDTARINAVIKIHPLVDLSLDMLEPVLNFNLRAQQGYSGYRNNYAKRFPDTYTGYTGVSNTNLVSPINGVLKAGAVETFAIESKDYTGFAIVIDEKFNFFEKNKDGVFELEITIPSGLDEIQIFGTRNGRNYNGLLRYDVD